MSDQTKLLSKDRSKALWLMALTLAVALIFAGSAVTQPKQPQAKQSGGTAAPTKAATLKPKPVKITCVNNVTSVDVKSVAIKKDTEEVEWKAVGSNTTGWKVKFDKPEKSPFADAEFYEGKNKSGQAMVAPNPYGFRYTVTIPGCKILDPDVIIR